MSAQAKILFITPRLDTGGTELHLLHLLPRLARRGYEVHLYELEFGGSLTERFVQAGIPIFGANISAPKTLRLITLMIHLTRQLRRHDYDIVHYFLPAAYIIGSMCSLMAPRARRIMSRRSLNAYQSKRPLLRFLEHRLHGLTHRIAGNSSAVIRELQQEGARPSQLRLIHNGVRIPDPLSDRERERIRAGLQTDADSLLLVCVANLLPYKGHAHTIEALAKASAQLPDGWKVLFIGRDGGIQSDLEELGERLGIAGHLLWLGERADPTPVVQACDILLHASLEEGFSNALLEGMAAGLPVVATATGGNVDAVTNRTTGLLVPVGEPQALADAIVQLADDKGLRDRLGAAGLHRARTIFDPERCVQGYVQLYQEVLQ